MAGSADHLVMGVDIGTTAVKVLVLDPKTGQYVQARSREHQLYSERPGWAEESPEDWIAGMVEAVAALKGQVDLARVRAIGVSGMVPALLLLDQEHRVLRRSIQQSDGRTGEEVAEIGQRFSPSAIFDQTGSWPNQQHILPRLLWLRRHEPAIWDRISQVVGSYDYIRGWMTGQFGVEENWAIESGLFAWKSGQWMNDLLCEFEIPKAWFSAPIAPVTLAGTLQSEPAALLGVPAGIAVVGGSADHVASALAVGIDRPGDLLIKFGGAGDILYCTDRPEFHQKLYFDRHDLADLFLLNGCMAASGSLVRWLLDRIGAKESDLGELDRQAAAVAPGSDGIVVLPYFLGEKTPLFDPGARGVVFGLMLHHQNAHLFRAVLESVIYGFAHHIEVLEEAGHSIGRILATNGGARSQIWRQIAADVLGRPVQAFPDHPGSALGVAMVAGMGAGLLSPEQAIELGAAGMVTHVPDPAAHAVYREGYRLYRELYERTKPLLELSHHMSEKGGAAR